MHDEKHYGKPGHRLSDAVKAEIVELARGGMSRNAIHRQTGVSCASISGLVKRAGLTFDRSRVQAATEARKVDLAAKRAELAAGLLDDVSKLRERLFAPTEYIDHGGKDFDEARWTQEEPHHADKLKLMQAAGAAIDRHLKLDAHDSDQHGLAAVDTWLKGMIGN